MSYVKWSRRKGRGGGEKEKSRRIRREGDMTCPESPKMDRVGRIIEISRKYVNSPKGSGAGILVYGR